MGQEKSQFLLVCSRHFFLVDGLVFAQLGGCISGMARPQIFIRAHLNLISEALPIRSVTIDIRNICISGLTVWEGV